jgi:membrane protein required for colicin V production
MSNLIWVDYCIVGIIGLSALIGLLRGFIREVFSLCAWFLAAWIGLRFSREFSAYLDPLISVPSARMAASFGILFLASLILASLIAFLLHKLVHSTGLTGTDRLAGMVFGIGRGVVATAVLVLLAGVTPLPADPWWKESALIPPFQSLALWLRDQLPSDVGNYIKFR